MMGLLKRMLGSARVLEELESQDYTDGPVPLSERRGLLTMGLLWITMVTCFPTVLIGFRWFGQGLSFKQVLWSLLASTAVIVAYSVPSCYLGAKTGLTYGLLSRFTFGAWGARLVSFNCIWVSVGWYALNAIFLTEGLLGLFKTSLPLAPLVAVVAVLMAFNNFFGFSGVANFARFLAAPVLIVWVAYTFCKAGGSCPPAVWNHPAGVGDLMALNLVSAFVLGIACWGNEADYWRYGKRRVMFPVIPLVVSLSIGQVLFPITGWMMAYLYRITDYAGATRLMNDYAFGGLAVIASSVLVISYVAVNDAGLYAAINAAESIKKTPRKWCVAALALAGAVTAVLLLGYKRSFEAVASLSCIFLPCATMVMMAESFIIEPLFRLGSPGFGRVPEPEELPPLRWPAMIALGAGCLFGTICSGFIPGTEAFNHGIPALESWLVSLFTYIVLRIVELRTPLRGIRTGSDEVATGMGREVATGKQSRLLG